MSFHDLFQPKPSHGFPVKALRPPHACQAVLGWLKRMPFSFFERSFRKHLLLLLLLLFVSSKHCQEGNAKFFPLPPISERPQMPHLAAECHSPEQLPEQHIHGVTLCREKQPDLWRCHLPAGLALQETERKCSVSWSITSYWAAPIKEETLLWSNHQNFWLQLGSGLYMSRWYLKNQCIFFFYYWGKKSGSTYFGLLYEWKKKGLSGRNGPENQRVLIEVSVTVCNYFHSKLWHRSWLRFLKQHMQQYQVANLQITRTKKMNSGTWDIAIIYASYCSWSELNIL